MLPRCLWIVRYHLLAAAFGVTAIGRPLPDSAPVHGWTILSGSPTGAAEVIDAAPAYGINHLELSQEIIADLKELRIPEKRAFATSLADRAHRLGVTEVAVWDHPLYRLDYYPEQFRNGPEGRLDLDSAAFWEWFKADYRQMLDLMPEADAVVLTFTGTDGKAENQQSQEWPTAAEKQAAVLNAVADVVIGERKMNLYVRLFPNDRNDDPALIRPVQLLRRPEVRLMIKQSPLDYFLTAPNDRYNGMFNHPTVVELELVGEFNGQGRVPNTWPGDILRRWRDLGRRPYVIGYVARTDRLGESRLVGKPGEVNLLALARAATDPGVTVDQVYDEFISKRYGPKAVDLLKPAFENAYDVVTSGYYTLGSALSDHSKLDFDRYLAPYAHIQAARWLNPPIAWVGHDVDREFHLWQDVVDHLAPVEAKTPEFLVAAGLSEVERASIHPDERMDETYLRYIDVEKAFGVALARRSLEQVTEAQRVLSALDYKDLHASFERGLLTARLQRAAADVYFGYRVWRRGAEFQDEYVRTVVQRGLTETIVTSSLIASYPVPPAPGQYVWSDDVVGARRYFRAAIDGGFPYVAEVASERVAAPAVLTDNSRVTLARWNLAPGECTPLLGGPSRVEVVIKGEHPGAVTYTAAGSAAHSISNPGPAPMEVISVEMKGCPPDEPVETPLPPSKARRVTEHTVPAEIVLENSRVKIERWRFAPGDSSPIHGHFLDHVYIVVHGSTVREITGDGSQHDDAQETGRAAFSPAHGKIHSFGNVGTNDYEMVSIELK